MNPAHVLTPLPPPPIIHIHVYFLCILENFSLSVFQSSH